MKVNTKNNKRATSADKLIVENWGPMIERTTGVKDPSKLEWMSQLAHNTAKHLNEDGFAMGSGLGAANNAAPGMFGGVYSPYATLYNTPGVGDAVPAGRPALTGADYADSTINGSGDKYPALLPLALKVAAKTIGFELVNTQPIQGPTGVLPYMDYVYAGGKQPYGATPAYNPATQNPSYNWNNGEREGQAFFNQYGLPSAFKAMTISMEDGDIKNFYEWRKATDSKLVAGTKLTAETDFVVEFIGLSRIDGDPMFKVVSGTKSLGEYFVGADAKVGEGDDAKIKGLEFTSKDGVKISVISPRLISMLEDNVQGFTGSGERDRDPWYGTYQDGLSLYEPMSRGTGEMTAPRQLSLQLFTKHIQVGTIMVGCSVTQEQVTDLQKQWGIDVVKMVENAGINELTNVINRHITSRLFGLGWKNHCKLVEVEGPSANLNMTFRENPTGSEMTPPFAIPQGDTQVPSGTYGAGEVGNEGCHYTNVALPLKPVQVAEYAHFENRDTLIKRIANNILLASNWIQQRGRYGAGTFIVTNITIASALQSNAHYTFSPIDNNFSQNAGQLYPLGTMCGMTLYVDPLMGGYDNRVLVGRKGGKDEPGVYFCPYVLADVVRIIAEGTMAPKLMIKSRYSLVDAGFFPETLYLTFYVDMANL